jgi:hypothetical protein
VTYETIDLQVRDRVAWITLNRPQAFNALDLQMAKDLFAVSNRLSSDPIGALCGADRQRRQGVLRRWRCRRLRRRPREGRSAGARDDDAAARRGVALRRDERAR